MKLDFLDVLGEDVVGSSTVSLKTCFASSPLSHWGAQLRPLAGGDLAMDSDHVDEGGRLFSIFLMHMVWSLLMLNWKRYSCPHPGST